MDAYYSQLHLFHGSIKDCIQRHVAKQTMHLWRDQMTDFTRNFQKYFFTKDYISNFFWSLSFQGIFYCPIDKKSFLQAQFVQNAILMDFDDQVQHCAIFHENYFICSSLPHLNLQPLYSYLIGIQDQTAYAAPESVNNPGHTPLQLLLKVLQFKNTGQMTRVHANQMSKEER